METALRGRPATSAPPDGSRTMTITNDPTRHEGEGSADEGSGAAGGRVPPIGVLRLRPKRMGNRVAWDDNVVDNEGAGKKKSKICCIYHKPKRYDESSDESSDSDSEHEHPHGVHSHSHPHLHGLSSAVQPEPVLTQQSHGEIHELELPEDEPNAYERPPARSIGKGKRKAVS